MIRKNSIIIIFLATILSAGFFVVASLKVLAEENIANQNTNAADQPNEEVGDLNQQIQERRRELEELNKRQEEYRNRLAIKQQESLTLSHQIEAIDDQIVKTEIEIEIAKNEIETLRLQIREVESKIADREKEISDQKIKLAELVRMLNKSKNSSPFVVLLKEDNFSQFFTQLNYLEELERQLKNSLDEVKQLKLELEAVKTELEDKENSIAETKEKLEAQQADYESQKGYKSQLLDETRSSEAQYQELLEAVRREQTSANSEIATIEEEIRIRLAGDERLSDNTATLSWPVSPAGGITAYFHDPAYIFRRLFEHPAIDLRAKQGTPVKAAASGYVARAKDAGLGYSYIMIIHGNGISTVYGHISSIKVEEESYVTRGQVIGLSGGMPGTSGAGRLTTGPHLHFEVRSEGIPVNPLDYLP